MLIIATVQKITENVNANPHQTLQIIHQQYHFFQSAESNFKKFTFQSNVALALQSSELHALSNFHKNP